MASIPSRTLKSKITVTLSPELVRRIDAFLDSVEAGSRSRLVEEALQLWLREQAQKDLERQTEEYYRSLSKAERQEDRQWSKITSRAAKRLWDE
jgi:metal-responsive CopG/Arc/MetJ family transcriptional regulator